MIAAWMLYIVAVSAMLAGAAWLVERAIRGAGAGTRGVWLLALFAPLGLGALAVVAESSIGSSAGASASGTLAVFALPELVVAADSGLRSLDGPLVILWTVMSGLLLGAWLVDALRSRRQFGEGLAGETDGVPTLVSPTVGPALVGVVRPRIVVPSWFLDLEPALRSLALSHEQEHARTRDPLLLAFGWAGLVAMPWNPTAWWMVRRLRMAVEIDCDARVLRSRPHEKRRYGTLLLEVASRAVMPRTASVALSRPRSAVERRIRAIVEGKSRLTPVRSATFVAAAGVLTVGACLAPEPDGGSIAGPDVSTRAVADLPPPSTERDLESGPTFTPFTYAPELRNASEVIAALAAEYPPLLRDAGIGGTVQVWFFIDGTGKLQQTRVNQSSGHPALDQAALLVAEQVKFNPAKNRGESVPAWVSMPITFNPPQRPEDQPAN